MKKRNIIQMLSMLSFMFIYGESLAQTWQSIPNAPKRSFRHDDLFFTSADTGWVVNVGGDVWKTNNGGALWTKIYSQSTTPFRCVGFLDSLRGFIGNLGSGSWSTTTDTIPIYKTFDGGITWEAITAFNGPTPKGICGMQIINAQNIVACGRVGGPSFFVKSTDGGNTWKSYDMSNYAGQLIDVYFSSPDTGFVVGGTSGDFEITKPIILYTNDGGATWTTKITGAKKGTHCWKIDKIKSTYYVSIENKLTGDTLRLLKSGNNGQDWNEIVVNDVKYGFAQGIGFVNESTGWIGGSSPSYMTTDGGTTFQKFSEFRNMNRIRFINDSIGYAVGQSIYKYTKDSLISSLGKNEFLSGYKVYQNTPNPFKKSTSIIYEIPKMEYVILEVFDIAGRKVKTLVNQKVDAGKHTVTFELPHTDNAHFICSILAGNYSHSFIMVSTKD